MARWTSLWEKVLPAPPRPEVNLVVGAGREMAAREATPVASGPLVKSSTL